MKNVTPNDTLQPTSNYIKYGGLLCVRRNQVIKETGADLFSG